MSEQFLDPVCGMTVDKATAAATSTYGETTFYFCSGYCKARFDGDPEAFVVTDEKTAACDVKNGRSCCH